MKAQPNNMKRSRESGNVFFIVMLGVVLFAALMFTFSRSARQGGENMSSRKTEAIVSDLLSYSQSVARATNRVMSSGKYSEADLDFDNGVVAGYANAGCGADTECKIFNPAGGAVNWKNPPPEVSASNWVISGENAVPDIGDDTAADLVLLLSGLNATVCAAINAKAGVAVSLPQDTDDIDTGKFTGTFANTERIGADADLGGQRAGCIQNTVPNPDEYVFYYVLWER